MTAGAAKTGWGTLGHTGAHALAARGRAPPVQICMQIIGTDSIVVGPNQVLEIERRSIAIYNPQNCKSRTFIVHEFAI